MRRTFFFSAVVFFAWLFAFPAYGRTRISVPKFEDRTEFGRCKDSAAAKAELDAQLQVALISRLMSLDRFQIKEREIRKIRPKHRLVGMIRGFELCGLGDKGGQEAEIVLDVQMFNYKGEMTHMFTGNAKVSHSRQGRAAGQAINVVVNELVKRIDNAIPAIKTARLPVKKRRNEMANNEYQVQLLRKPATRPKGKK